MDGPSKPIETAGISMSEPSGISDLSDTSDLLEVSETTGLSPLTSSLDHHLTLREENNVSPKRTVNMGIENTWTETSSSAADYAIPLPPPPGFDDFGDVGSEPVRLENGGSVSGLSIFLPNPAFNNLFGDASDIQDESVVEASTPAGVCGLRNLGNTCFMAAGLQCLTATPPVLRHFLELQQRGEKLPPSGSLMEHFSSLLSKMWSGRYSVVKPTEFKQTLGAHHTQFKDYRQHDCQEFLALLLDSLHEQMNTTKTAKNHLVSTTTATTANLFATNKNVASAAGREIVITDTAAVTKSGNSNGSRHMDMYDHASLRECPDSPNATMAGSPTGFDSPMRDLSDSAANSSPVSPPVSPLNDDDDRNDEEARDSDEAIGTKSSFVENKTRTCNDSSITSETFSKYEKFAALYDILKEAKTSNANFLVNQQECNNEIHYDSQKFPKENVRRMALDNSNLTENHDFDNKTLSTKRIKEINVEKSNCSYECVSGSSDAECDNGLEKCNVKRMRLEDHEKNFKRCDGHDTSGDQFGRLLQNGENGAVAAQDEVEADKHWAKHLRTNRSVIVDTFQGQFKSTVVCAVCKHVSVTYEPFMYLSVPLPHAMERQLTVTYVPSDNSLPVRCVVSLNKQSRVGKLKEELLVALGKEDVPTNNVALAEVFENHIARILDDNSLLRYVNDTNRSIYAFELSDPLDAYALLTDSSGDRIVESDTCRTDVGSNEEIGPCTICLEELDGDLKRHDGNNCSFIMCDPCIENYFKTQTEPRTCPVCSTHVVSSSFTKIDQTGRPRPAVRILNVPLVLRHDTNEATNNRKSAKLFGYPRLVKLPSRVNAKDLHEVVKRVVSQEESYTVHFVTGQGYHCSRCMYTAHCTGCSIPESGMIVLQNGDTLAVRYTENVPTIASPIDHASVSGQRPYHPLSLYDCLQAFSQSEMLDEHNPWFCPKCERNRCATKTLTVHRYPMFLIVYLKRFVFYECVSMKLDDKVTFPLAGLSVGKHLYDLYACVCHFGGVSAGHYTAYAKNPRSDLWHYYNDEATSKQKPQEEDFSNAYILFYSRQGTNTKSCNL